ncbi:unknown [Singapore grouper iridovirus]|uniref:Uncharacterized protein n=1 Tax=Singapore grouper iridovirus TaxID=262968 RepID=Q5YFP8_9VIRU|nr:hypothetical protein ORF017R [Singapore grouper iridovirus]AAS18032.1 unknown [Singapore grouper iridovirus]WAU86726.1 hypothetical protein ORF017R [Singapore grouper iridovirus]
MYLMSILISPPHGINPKLYNVSVSHSSKTNADGTMPESDSNPSIAYLDNTIFRLLMDCICSRAVLSVLRSSKKEKLFAEVCTSFCFCSSVKILDICWSPAVLDRVHIPSSAITMWSKFFINNRFDISTLEGHAANVEYFSVVALG